MKKNVLLSGMLTVLFALGVNAQSYYTEDFESGANDWNFQDDDGDGNNWGTIDASGLNSELGSQSIISWSYIDNVGPQTPDNLAISPEIDLTGVTGSNVFLTFQYITEPSYPAENYSVYATTSDDAGDILAETPVYTETVAQGGVLTKRVVDLSDYIGENIYLTFRHHDCEDQYYLIIDNISVETLLEDNVSLDSVEILQYILTDEDTFLDLTVTNKGATTITSLTADWDDETDNNSSNISVNIEPGETTTVEHSIPVNYSDITQKDISVVVEEVNGNTDPDPSDNTQDTSVQTISQDAGAKVLIEEGTGTWCGWCPRGFVGMKNAEDNYPDTFIGIAVHNQDPMQNNEYNAGAAFAGFPGMNVDRTILGAGVGVDNIENYIVERSAYPNPVAVEVTPSVDGNEFSVDVDATFYSDFENADFRLAAIVVEDGVKGSSSGYNQVNYYAGGGQGPMNGWENLPNPVPAEDMVYDHVGRALLGGYHGQEESVSSSIADGDVASYTFNYTVPEEYTGSISVVGIVIDNSTGQVLNSNKASLGVLGTDVVEKRGFSVYPNPASDVVNLDVVQGGKYAVKVYDMNGKNVLNQSPQELSSNSTLSLDISRLAQGTYVISIENKNQSQSFSKQLLVK